MSAYTGYRTELDYDRRIGKSGKGISVKETGNNGLLRTEVVITDEKTAAKYKKPPGKFVTFDIKALEDTYSEPLTEAIAKDLFDMLRGAGSVLVAGLGNRDMTADALGPLTAAAIIPGKGRKAAMYTIAPGVSGTTGLETLDIIRGIVSQVRPDAVICVDSLASKKTSRIGKSFQITNTGIVPGGGVENAREPLDSGSLGVPVVAIGVPMVVYAATIVGEALAGSGAATSRAVNIPFDLVVTPREIDVLVRLCAGIISNAINIFAGAF